MRIFTLGLMAIFFSSLVMAQPGSQSRQKKPDHYVLIHAGTLLAVPGKKPQSKMTVVVKNNRIDRIEKGFMTESSLKAPAKSEVDVVDLSDKFVLPGLMDAHVHLSHQPSRGRHRTQRGDRDKTTSAQYTINTMVFARRTLAAGFTSVRDLGSNDGQSVFAVRNAINAGRMIGPRIQVAGSALAITGGHGDELEIDNSSNAEARLMAGTCDGPIECRKAVRFQYKLGADVIKFTSTGGFSSNTGLDPQFFPDEIDAIVSTAHRLGVKATAHAYSAESIKDAVRSGVDSIEHGSLLDKEAIKMMKKKGVWLVPTISASYPPPIFNIPNPPSVQLRNEYRAFERAYEAGVKIGFGTDAGTFAHGTNAKEFDMLVSLGMSEEDAIYSATVSNAGLLGVEKDLGTLEGGKLADIIAVKGNPLKDISVLHQVDFVMKDGKVAKRDGEMIEPFTY